MHDELLSVIRRYDPDVIGFYCSPGHDSSWLNQLQPQAENNVVWSPHCYFYRPDETWYHVNYDRTNDLSSLRNLIAGVVDKLKNSYGAPIWWGEILSYDANSMKDSSYVDDCLSIFKSFNVPNWAYWMYGKVDTWEFPRDAAGNDKTIVSILQKHLRASSVVTVSTIVAATTTFPLTPAYMGSTLTNTYTSVTKQFSRSDTAAVSQVLKSFAILGNTIHGSMIAQNTFINQLLEGVYSSLYWLVICCSRLLLPAVVICHCQ